MCGMIYTVYKNEREAPLFSHLMLPIRADALITLGPYESFPNDLIRRVRRKDIASTSRPSRTYEIRSTGAGT